MFAVVGVHLFLADGHVGGEDERRHQHRNSNGPLLEVFLRLVERDRGVGLEAQL